MLKKLIYGIATSLLVGFYAPRAQAQSIKVDPALPKYKKASGIGGNLSSVGSDTLNNMVTLWAEAFHKLYPNSKVQIEGKGSATAPPALAQGVSQLGPMSREMKEEEKQTITAKNPDLVVERFDVALDGIAVYANKDNPVKSLTLDQIDGIFSSTHKSGAPNIDTWGQAGLTGAAWKDRSVSLYGRNSASGTYSYFKEHALSKGDYKTSLKERPGSAAVVQSVSEDKYGIGYSGAGFLTSNVKEVSLVAKEGGTPVPPTYQNILTQKYPLARKLYIYVVHKKDQKIDPLVAEFLKLVLSKEGQEIVIKDGFFPMPKALVDENLKKL